MNIAILDIAHTALELFNNGSTKTARSVAKVALDLSRSATRDTLELSAGGISIGDGVRLKKSIKKDRHRLPKDTKGNIVGFSSDGKYLCLFFPGFYPDGILSLHSDEDLHFMHKPQVADPHIWKEKAVDPTVAEVDEAADILTEAGVMDLRKNMDRLKTELLALLSEAGINPKKLHGAFTFGHVSALFQAKTLYARVLFYPYPDIAYEIGFPGIVGETMSRNRADAVHALKSAFDRTDRGSDED